MQLTPLRQLRSISLVGQPTWSVPVRVAPESSRTRGFGWALALAKPRYLGVAGQPAAPSSGNLRVAPELAVVQVASPGYHAGLGRGSI